MGQVGCGKSSLLSALLAEMDKVEGHVTVKVGGLGGGQVTHGQGDGQRVMRCFMIFYDLVKQVGTTFVLLFFCALLEGKIVVSSSSCCVSAPRIVPGM